MANNFDAILSQLHGGAPTGKVLTDKETPVVVTERRNFEIPSGYNTTLGYVGDVNSQVVTFELPLQHEGHQLNSCNNAKLFWKNVKSGREGVSKLISVAVGENTWTTKWEVPPEAMTSAGAVELSISLYDTTTPGGQVSFAWNTPICKGFSVGDTLSSVSDVLEESYLPAKNEILIVNTENRNIVAPADWNSVFCSYGDIGVSKIFFEVDQYVRGINLLDANTEVSVGVYYLTNTVKFEPATVKQMFNTVTNKKNNKVLVTWDVPEAITNNDQLYTGKVTISLRVNTKDNSKRWSTSSFDKLTIAPSTALNDIIEIVARDEELLTRLVEEEVDEVIENKVTDGIENYMTENEFVIDGTTVNN